MKLTNQQRRAIYRFYREEMGYTPKEAANARNRPYRVFAEWRHEHYRLKQLNRRYRKQGKPTIPLPKKPDVRLTKSQRETVRRRLKDTGVPSDLVSKWSRRVDSSLVLAKAKFDGLRARLRYDGKDVKKFLSDMEKATRGARDENDWWDRFQGWYLENVGVRFTDYKAG